MTDEGRLIGGRYRLTERIGVGSMGLVWRAEDEKLRRTVAIKQLTSPAGVPAAELTQALARARREARITAKLRHPNAVTMFDVVEEDGLPWLVIEYVAGHSLAAELAGDRTLPPARVAAIGAQVAAALVQAHQLGIVHRDVKPGNILLAEDGTAKLADFGISRAADEGTLTATGFVAGTPAYLAPEVARGGAPSPESDAFALGATLYRAVEGYPPFGPNENVLALLQLVAAGRVVPPRQAGPLTETLTELLRPNPADRMPLPEAERALAALAALAEPDEPTVRVPVAAPEPRVRQGFPVPTRAIVVGVLLIVVAGGTAVGGMMMGGGDAASPPSSGGPATTTPPPTTTSPLPANLALAAFLAHYYSLLPNQLTEAATLLSPRYLAKVGGFPAFQGFYATVSSVRVRSVTVTSATTATAILVFTKKDHTTSVETYRFTFVTENGTLLISDAELS